MSNRIISYYISCIQVINNGEHGVVSKVTVVISWPYEIASSGEYLLYIIGYPQRVSVQGDVRGSSQCHILTEYINPLGYEVMRDITCMIMIKVIFSDSRAEVHFLITVSLIYLQEQVCLSNIGNFQPQCPD